MVQLAGGSSINSACLYARQKLNITSEQKYLSPCASYKVPRNQPSNEKSQAKNGFNFGYTFWRQYKKNTQEGREAKTEAKNGFEKASPIPAAMEHEFHTIHRWRVFTSVVTGFHYPQQHRGCNSQIKFSGHKDFRLLGGLCFHGTFGKLLFASAM